MPIHSYIHTTIRRYTKASPYNNSFILKYNSISIYLHDRIFAFKYYHIEIHPYYYIVILLTIGGTSKIKGNTHHLQNTIFYKKKRNQSKYTSMLQYDYIITYSYKHITI